MARPVIHLRPFAAAAEAALAVYRNLDIHDLVEIEVMAGRFDPLRAVAGRMMGAGLLIEAHVAEVERPGGRRIPFAVLALGQTGFPGVAQGEFLAANHGFYRRELAQLVIMARAALPEIAAAHGLRRIEFRAYARHPSAALLGACLGFREEARLRGFGPDGMAEIVQFAWVREGEPETQPAADAA